MLLMHFDHTVSSFLWLFYHALLSNTPQLIDYNGLNITLEGLQHATICPSVSYQTTIDKPVATKGVGLHTAVKSHLRLVPAPANTGIVFRRVDLDNFEIEAHVRNVARVSYATSLMKKGVLLSTTEHVLAALYSCGVDNVYIELDALELPILDGSSQPFIEMLAQAGTRRLRKRRRYLRVVKPLEVSEGGRRIGIYPAEDFQVRCFVDYKHPNGGPQEVEMTV